MKDYERDSMREIILGLLERGRVCWTDLKKKVLGSCRTFATDSGFSHEMSYLTSVGYIRKLGPKGKRVPYEITEYGRAQLDLLRNRRSKKSV